MTISPGAKLGPYEILAFIGAGGMGEVYRARDTRLDRTVAVKILPNHLSSSPESKQRFEREARAISSLNHPNVCHLYDIGSQDGTDFLVMEFLEGETLYDRLRKGAVLLPELIKIGTEISEALEVAHRHGIVHRDLKPGNVMLTRSGAKLMDFGLAKPSATGTAGSGSSPIFVSATKTIDAQSPVSPLTTAGRVVGTIQYMSPEQLQGLEVDVRSDIFALGALLYEMATGKPAFAGKSQITVASAILEQDPPPVSSDNPVSPPALDYLVSACLAKDREQRFQSAHDVRLQLRWVGDQSGTGAAQAEGKAGWPRLAWAAAGFLALLAVVAGADYLRLANRRVAVVRSSILPPRGTVFVTEGSLASSSVLAPDGARMAFTAQDGNRNTLLYVRALDSSEAIPLTGTDGAYLPFWSPDSRALGFFAGGKLKRVDAGGGPAQILCDAPSGKGGTWGKDGTIVFATAPTHRLMRVPASGGAPEPASNLDASKGEHGHAWPYFLPDGEHFLYQARSSRGPQEHALYLGKLGSLQAKVLTHSESMAVYASGFLLFVRGRTLVAQPFNAERAEIAGEAIPVAENVAFDVNRDWPVFSVSDNGMLVYQPGDNSPPDEMLAWFSRDGKETGIIAHGEDFQGPAFSPDGTRLAVAIVNRSMGGENIWILDLQRGTKTRLTFGAGVQSFPVWTPDGKTVFYASNAQGPTLMYAKSSDGAGEERAVLRGSAQSAIPASVSPDGKYLAYRSRTADDGRGIIDIWALPLFGDGKPIPVVQNNFSSSAAAISPDGKWMAYGNNESGPYEIYVTSFPGGGAKWQVSINGGSEPEWRQDGRELFFVDASNTFMAVDVAAANGGVKLGIPHALFKPVGVNHYWWYAVSADGKKFAVDVVTSRAATEPLTLVQNWTAGLKK